MHHVARFAVVVVPFYFHIGLYERVSAVYGEAYVFDLFAAGEPLFFVKCFDTQYFVIQSASVEVICIDFG